MERHEAGTARIVPIIVDYCHWEGLPVSRLHVVPLDNHRNVKPLSAWDNANMPLSQIASEIWRISEMPTVRDYSRTHFTNGRPYLSRANDFLLGTMHNLYDLNKEIVGEGVKDKDKPFYRIFHYIGIIFLIVMAIFPFFMIVIILRYLLTELRYLS